VSLLIGFATGCLDTTGPGEPSHPANETFAASLGVNISQMTQVANDLYIQDIVVGTGATATSGKTLRVTYTGWLTNGTQFDSNVGGTAFQLVLGVTNVIAGWHLGLVGMKAGGKRRLVIGSDFGYGPDVNGSIPANSTLVYTVELLSVQ